MAKVVAKIKVKGKTFEIHVDLEEALKFKAGKGGDIMTVLDSPNIYTDLKKGTRASLSDLKESFGTTDTYEIAKKIILFGEIQKTQEFRDEQREAKIKQVINLIIKNAVDQHGLPYTEERIKRALEEAKVSIDNRLPEQQIPEIIEKLKTVIPIKIETKRLKIIVPARFTGQAYSLFKDIKESEEWLQNGDLQVIINIPSGMQLDFYDKLNSITHGSARSQELPQK